jgi:hypothetical protein
VKIGLRRKTHFISRFNMITLVQISARKYSDFVFPEIVVPWVIPARQEGRFAIVTTRGAGCDGRIDVAA